MQLLVDDARRTAALRGANAVPPPAQLERVVTEQAAGNLADDPPRRSPRAARRSSSPITMLLATLLLSTLVEEKSNKVIEVLAAAVPLDAVFLGKLIAMLGISLVGLALWGGMVALGYTFFLQVFAGLGDAAAGGAGDRLADLDRPPDPLLHHQFHAARRAVPRHRRARRATSARSRPSRCR